MNYVFLACAVVCIGFQFVFTKLYQKRAGTTFTATLLFGVGGGAVALLFFLCLNVFSLKITAFSAVIALCIALCSTVNNCAGIKAMSCGKVAVFTQFMMLGGMLVPFVYGVCVWNEHAGVWRYIALVLLITSLVLPCFEKSEGKNSKLFYVLCVSGFMFNGLLSVLSKTHQISSRAVPTFDFMITVYMFTVVLNAITLVPFIIINKRRSRMLGSEPSEQLPGKEVAASRSVKPLLITAVCVAAFALVSSGGYVMQLFGARNLPAVVLYPVVTGGTVVLSAVFGLLFFKEKIGKFVLAGIVLAFAATCLFLI